jgi:hypothetical protein
VATTLSVRKKRYCVMIGALEKLLEEDVVESLFVLLYFSIRAHVIYTSKRMRRMPRRMILGSSLSSLRPRRLKRR